MPESPPPGARFPLGGPTTAAWREDALTRVKELEGLTEWIQAERTARVNAERNEDDQAGLLVETINEHLEGARASADEDPKRKLWKRLKSSSSGSAFERTLGNLDAAEADILRLAPAHYVCGLMPSLQAHVNRYLRKDDPRRERLCSLVSTAEAGALNDSERTAAVAAYHAANSQRRRELLRLRSFRNVLFAAASLMLVVAVGLGILGALRPQMIPLCFHVTDQAKVVCPTRETSTEEAGAAGGAGGEQAGDVSSVDADEVIGDTVSRWDVALVEILGLVAAALASAFALRGIRGTSMPYSLPVALALLKLPTGALTAVLGLLLMRGGFVPGLSALDTPAQILSWAIVFGYAQQLFTRFVDQQGYAVLEDVRGRGAAGDREGELRPAV